MLCSILTSLNFFHWHVILRIFFNVCTSHQFIFSFEKFHEINSVMENIANFFKQPWKNVMNFVKNLRNELWFSSIGRWKDSQISTFSHRKKSKSSIAHGKKKNLQISSKDSIKENRKLQQIILGKYCKFHQYHRHIRPIFWLFVGKCC